MNWAALSAVGEIIGAITVLVTLAYLAVQIRQNTRAVQSSATDSSINRISVLRQSLAENAELASLYLKGGNDPQQLDELEALRYRMLLHSMFLSLSNVFSQTKYTNLPTSNWESQTPIVVRMISSPGGTWFWENYRTEFESEFRDEVDRLAEHSN